jgi:hypothetical protein
MSLDKKPCDMGEMCLNCQPRGSNGECPDAKPAPSQIVGSLSWSCAVPWEVVSWLSAHPPTIDRAAPAESAPAIAASKEIGK